MFKQSIKTAFVAVLLLCSASAFAQTAKNVIKGTVTDAATKEAVIGGAVQVANTTRGVVTDIDGNYEIAASEGETLVFSSLSYKTKEVKVGKSNVINVTLDVDAEGLEEVVFIGYGTAKKRDLTGAIAQVKASAVEKEAPRSMQDILRGGVAGITMDMSTNVQGTADIQIRGKNTLSAGSSPLYVLDGVIYNGSITDINPNDIESIDVLKDASSVAIYGAKAANGVIAITTKKGSSNSEGKPTITFNGNIGIAQAAHTTPIVDGAGFIQFRQDYFNSLMTDAESAKVPGKYSDPRTLQGVDMLAWYNYDNKTPVTTLPDTNAMVSKWLQRLNLSEIEIQNYMNGVETDWDDYYFPKALQQDYTVGISNRTDKSSYYMSLSYTDRQSYIAGGGYNNIRGRVNVESKVTKWLTTGINTNFAARDGSRLQANTDSREQLSPFTQNLIDTPEDVHARWPNGDSLIKNPFWDNKYTDRYDMSYDLAMNLYGILHLPFGFEFQSNFSPRLHWSEYYNHQSSQNIMWGAESANSERTTGKTYNWQLDNVLRWKQNFGDHRIEVTLAQNAEKNQSWSTTAKNKLYSPSDVLRYHYLDAGTSPSVASSDTYDTGDALMARLFYSYRNRYMVTASVRRDGYSAFGVENPRGTFPSVALGWVFSEEGFLKGANSWLNYGKLRVSYGVNGNRDIGRYAALAQLTSGLYEYIDSDTGKIYQTSQIYVSKLGNSHLRWEKTKAFNVGLDYTLFNDFVDGSIDYYGNTTNDLLVSRSLPKITGFDNIYTNLGELQNHGFEFLANFHPIKNTNFRWDSTITFYLNRRKVTHLYGDMVDVLDDAGNVIGQKESDDSTNGWYIGHDPNEIYAYQWDGVWQLGEEEQASKYGNKPGDFKYVDQNNDGALNVSDKVFTGKYTTPRYQFSWRNDFTIYKNWSLGFMMYAKIGQWGTYNRAANSNGNYDRYTAYSIDRWTVDNPTNDYARIGSVNKGDHYVNKSFLRMESINVSYNIPKSVLRKISVENARISFAFRNPFVITKWEFGDVEGGDYTPQSFNLGINITL